MPAQRHRRDLNSGGCIRCSRFFYARAPQVNRPARGCRQTSGNSLQTNKNMRYWLMKSEPDETSIDDALASPGATVPWTGVRNYQARNFMRDQMQIGDGVLFYHSSCAEPGIAGLAEVASTAYPDPAQFEPASPYFDPKSDPASPRGLLVDVRALRKTRLIGLPELRTESALSDMLLLRRGNRLSITPVTHNEWHHIVNHLIGRRAGARY